MECSLQKCIQISSNHVASLRRAEVISFPLIKAFFQPLFLHLTALHSLPPTATPLAIKRKTNLAIGKTWMGSDILTSYITAEKICSYPLSDWTCNPFSQRDAIKRVVSGILNQAYILLMASYILCKHRNNLTMSQKTIYTVLIHPFISSKRYWKNNKIVILIWGSCGTRWSNLG